LCYRQLGETARARAEFVKVDRDEYLSWSLIALADIDREDGRVEQAVERYAAIGGSFASPIASFKLGECYELLGDRAKSIEAYRTIASNFPRSFEAAQAKEKLLRLGRAKAERTNAAPPKGGEEGTAIEKGPVAETTPQAIYTIQFGAFGSKDAAERMAKRISSVIAEARVENVDTGDRILYRVRAGRYSKRDTAEQDAARAREKLGIPCTIVPLR
jgi:tetratricopeptide (TPR) repeat protein